jgi:hypothetical protein
VVVVEVGVGVVVVVVVGVVVEVVVEVGVGVVVVVEVGVGVGVEGGQMTPLVAFFLALALFSIVNLSAALIDELHNHDWEKLTTATKWLFWFWLIVFVVSITTLYIQSPSIKG